MVWSGAVRVADSHYQTVWLLTYIPLNLISADLYKLFVFVMATINNFYAWAYNNFNQQTLSDHLDAGHTLKNAAKKVHQLKRAKKILHKDNHHNDVPQKHNKESTQ